MAANAKKTIYINYNDSISDDRVREFSEFCLNKIEKYQPEILYFLFASPGGSTDAGITLYNFLRALPQKIVMHNMSSVDSIGTVVFLAGDERFASPHSTFLFHSVKKQHEKRKNHGHSRCRGAFKPNERRSGKNIFHYFGEKRFY